MTTDNTLPLNNQQAVSIPYGGFWRRFGAFLLDGIISFIPPSVICLIPIVWQAQKMMGTQQQAGSSFLFIIALYLLWCVLGFIFTWLYFAFLESGKHQATWGKRLLGLKVVDEQGRRITFARATGRYFAKMLSYVVFYIGFIMMPFTNRKRALHDIIAGTYVVKSSFQQGDALSPTQAHIGWLVCVCILLVGAYVGLIGVGLWADKSLAKDQAATAAAQLQAIRADNENWDELPGTEEMDFLSDDEGNLYVSFYSRNATEYVLMLPAEQNNVCCLNTDTAECEDIAVTPCD